MALLPTDPKKQKQLLIGLAPLLLVFAYWYFFHGAITEETTAMQERLERLEASNARARTIAAQGGPELERKLELYTAHIARIEQLIPTSEEVPELLHTINQQADEAGVDVAAFQPQPEAVGPYYTRQVYEITVMGAYHDIGRYLAAVGSMPRIITPIGLRLSVNSADADAETATLEADFRIETYVLPAGPAEETGTNENT